MMQETATEGEERSRELTEARQIKSKGCSREEKLKGRYKRQTAKWRRHCQPSQEAAAEKLKGEKQRADKKGAESH